MPEIRKLIGQQMMIGLQGPELLSEEVSFIVENNICGVTLFGRNVESPEQVHKLTSDIQNLRHKMMDQAPLLIAIDMEGGRVARLKEPFTQWPPAAYLGEIDSTTTSFNYTEAMGEELKAFGINVDFAPCTDILTNPDNVLIGDRSLGTDPEHVGKHASAFVRGYIKAGIIPCAKHFPGHGNTIVDSHEDLPVEKLSLEQLLEREAIPFKRAFRARLDLVMTAHIKFPQIDAENPVTFSEKFLKEILRDDFRYKNLVITDDLDMKALRNHYSIEEIPMKALNGGSNILLYCNEFDVPPQSIEALEKAVAEERVSRDVIQNNYEMVLSMKSKKLLKPDPLPLEEALGVMNSDDVKKLVDAVFNKKSCE